MIGNYAVGAQQEYWEGSDISHNEHGSPPQNFCPQGPEQMGQDFLHIGPRWSLLVAVASL